MRPHKLACTRKQMALREPSFCTTQMRQRATLRDMARSMQSESESQFGLPNMQKHLGVFQMQKGRPQYPFF